MSPFCQPPFCQREAAATYHIAVSPKHLADSMFELSSNPFNESSGQPAALPGGAIYQIDLQAVGKNARAATPNRGGTIVYLSKKKDSSGPLGGKIKRCNGPPRRNGPCDPSWCPVAARPWNLGPSGQHERRGFADKQLYK